MTAGKDEINGNRVVGYNRSPAAPVMGELSDAECDFRGITYRVYSLLQAENNPLLGEWAVLLAFSPLLDHQDLESMMLTVDGTVLHASDLVAVADGSFRRSPMDSALLGRPRIPVDGRPTHRRRVDPGSAGIRVTLLVEDPRREVGELARGGVGFSGPDRGAVQRGEGGGGTALRAGLCARVNDYERFRGARRRGSRRWGEVSSAGGRGAGGRRRRGSRRRSAVADRRRRTGCRRAVSGVLREADREREDARRVRAGGGAAIPSPAVAAATPGTSRP